MEDSGIARGNSARQANKKLREQRILNLAVHLVASDGMEDFTINPLEIGILNPIFRRTIMVRCWRWEWCPTGPATGMTQ